MCVPFYGTLVVVWTCVQEFEIQPACGVSWALKALLYVLI